MLTKDKAIRNFKIQIKKKKVLILIEAVLTILTFFL